MARTRSGQCFPVVRVLSPVGVRSLSALVVGGEGFLPVLWILVVVVGGHERLLDEIFSSENGVSLTRQSNNVTSWDVLSACEDKQDCESDREFWSREC